MNVKSSHILVIGAASVDLKGRAQKALQLGASVPGDITVSFGGVGRNVAGNLARLGQPTILLSAVGDDAFDTRIPERTASGDRNVGFQYRHGKRVLAVTLLMDREYAGADSVNSVCIGPCCVNRTNGPFRRHK